MAFVVCHGLKAQNTGELRYFNLVLPDNSVVSYELAGGINIHFQDSVIVVNDLNFYMENIVKYYFSEGGNVNTNYTLTVEANPAEGGTVIQSGSGIYTHGEVCTLTATANPGYIFASWTKNGVIVSTNAVYSFTVTESAAFVANFTQSQGNITQVTNLSQGWNWWSTYIEQEGVDGLEMLEGSLGANGHQIKSQTDYVNNYGTMWMGMLTSINNEETYMLNNNADCQIEMTGTPVSPADHPITVSSGWNWIGYPCTNTMSVSEAFVDFEPAYGDMVKSQSDYSMCFNGIWIGQLLDITPGTGLMYKSNRTETATLVYPEGGRNMEATVSIPRASHWTNDIHSYPDNMTVMAVVELDDVELTSDNYELAVFADGECRGSVRLMYVEQLNRYVAFLTITGEESTTLNFGLYNIQTGKEIINAEEQINYVTNAMVGSIDEPYTIHFRGTTGMDEWADNPVIGDKLYVRSPNKEGFVVISDMLGRVVFNQQIGESCVIDLKWLAPNTVYVIKVNNQSIKFIRR